MDRRQFLVRSAALAGAVITPTFIERAWASQENGKAPLLPNPQVELRYLLRAFPFDDHFSLDLLDANGKEIDASPKTFSLMLFEYGYTTPQQQLQFVMQGWDLNPAEGRRMLVAPPPADWGELYMDRHGGPMAMAYKLLKGLDLGPRFSKNKFSSRVGEITFVDGYHIGCEMAGVEVPDTLSLSLLQARLNELSLPARVVLA